MGGLRIVTWNVNGIRNPFSYEPWRSKRTFASMFDILEADIIVLQETKIQRKDLRDDMVLIPGWDCFFSLPAREKGKFGVVIYTRQSRCAPIRAEEGLTGTLRGPNSSLSYCELPEEQQIGGYPTATQMVNAPGAPDIAADFDLLDCEGRVVILEFPAFILFGVYAPAARDETRVAYRAGFFNLLDARVRNLIRLGKRVILTGDLNVSKEPLDVANIEADLRKSGTTVEEYFNTASRRMFNHLVCGGSVSGDKDVGRGNEVLWDVCRGFHPSREGMYTHWETKKNARPANFGSRIDYILCSVDMKDWFSESNIQEGLMGSDHCPVYAVIKDMIDIEGRQVNTLNVMNPVGMFCEGKRQREYMPKDRLSMSGRLIPDFTGRQNIRDMFTKKSTLPTNSPSQTVFLEETRDDIRGIQQATSPTSTATDSTPTRVKNRPTASNAVPKRALPETSAGIKKPKKMKSNGAGGLTSPKGKQSQISGFFKPKVSTPAFGKSDGAVTLPAYNPASDSYGQMNNELDESHQARANSQQTEADNSLGGSVNDSEQVCGSSGEARMSPAFDPARDLEESKEGWAKLFSKPQVPLCEHGEPCKQMLSKKPGMNYMRWFYMCARPLGPSGDKEKGSQWRCRTFTWMNNMS